MKLFTSLGVYIKILYFITTHLQKLNDGYNRLENGEEVYYISNPAVGLWAYTGRFESYESMK